MIESPLLQEVLAERVQRMILRILEDRWGAVPDEVAGALKAVRDDDRLDELASEAARCPDLEAFRRQLIP